MFIFANTGQLSAFLSNIIREPAEGRRFVCPMSAGATTWAASIVNVVDNLVHAAQLAESSIATHRAITLPALRFCMAQLVDGIAAVHGEPVRALVDYAPDPKIEALFGRFPLLETPFAHRVGFTQDGDIATWCDGLCHPRRSGSQGLTYRDLGLETSASGARPPGGCSDLHRVHI